VKKEGHSHFIFIRGCREKIIGGEREMGFRFWMGNEIYPQKTKKKVCLRNISSSLLLVLITNNKHAQPYIKQRTHGFYTQEILKGENSIQSIIPMCVSIA
jgi:hypothetical protein